MFDVKSLVERASMKTAIICLLLLTGCATIKSRYAQRSPSKLCQRWQNEAGPQIQIQEPSSWGSLGAMIIGIALMPPANDLLMMLRNGVLCAQESRRSAMNETDIRRAGLNNP